TCSVFVLPVPVAPATSPWRVSIASGTCTTASGDSVPSCTPRPRTTAGPSVAYAAAIRAPNGSEAIRAPDDVEHDLVRPGADAVQARVAPDALDPVLDHVTGAAVDL